MRALAFALTVVATAALLPAAERVDFERQVLPLLEARCFQCHAGQVEGRRTRPKAGLSLDSRDGILGGGNSGPAVVPGDPGKSLLLSRVSLPEDHDDIMPPDGDGLTQVQRALVRQWIAEGADFGGWTGAAGPTAPKAADDGTAPPPSERFRVYARLAEGVRPGPGAAIRAAGAAGARVEPVVPGSPLLRVEFLADPERATDASLDALKGLRGHVAILGLNGAKVTDRGVPAIARLTRLVRLDLQRTGLTDAGLAALAKEPPPALRRLNLYGTEVTDKGLDWVSRIGTLRELFLWGTKTTDAGVAELHKLLPDCRVHRTRALPAAEERAQRANRRRR